MQASHMFMVETLPAADEDFPKGPLLFWIHVY
jgi:hypothetical protein